MTTLNKAQEVLQQINNHYDSGVPSKCDLCHHLRANRVDGGFPMVHKHNGFNSPMDYDDGYPLVMYFDDDSLLIVVMDRIFTGVES
jgi:hypothetical protein